MCNRGGGRWTHGGRDGWMEERGRVLAICPVVRAPSGQGEKVAPWLTKHTHARSYTHTHTHTRHMYAYTMVIVHTHTNMHRYGYICQHTQMCTITGYIISSHKNTH